MKLDHNSDKPLHIQAEEILRRLIESEEYKNGKLFPNEVELSEQLHISRNTLRQAINKLVFEGLLVRKKGYGTKVVKKGIVGGVKNWLSFSQEMKMLGIEIRNFELHISLKRPTEEIGTFFDLGSNPDTRCVVEIWRKQLGENGYDIILGVRSSVFLPFRNLGLVIVDEEHENTYKQQDPAPRYHARSAAIVLAAMYGAKTLLGTATPSIESWQNAGEGKYGFVQLKERYKEIQLPEIIPVDIKELHRKKRMVGLEQTFF